MGILCVVVALLLRSTLDFITSTNTGAWRRSEVRATKQTYWHWHPCWVCCVFVCVHALRSTRPRPQHTRDVHYHAIRICGVYAFCVNFHQRFLGVRCLYAKCFNYRHLEHSGGSFWRKQGHAEEVLYYSIWCVYVHPCVSTLLPSDVNKVPASIPKKHMLALSHKLLHTVCIVAGIIFPNRENVAIFCTSYSSFSRKHVQFKFDRASRESIPLYFGFTIITTCIRNSSKYRTAS